MRLSILFFMALFCANAVYAEESREGATIYNEYHNSTVYSGNQPAQNPYPSQESEGIRVYRDPDSGDRVISVRSRMYQNQQQQTPVYIDPVIRPW